MFKGLYTALVTPFKYGELDEEAFVKLVDWQIESGVHGLVVAGSTGEGQTLTPKEYSRIIDLCVKMANKRVPVIAGTGTNSTSTTIEYTQEAKFLGVDGVMLVAPYYNKPGQEGMYRHFREVHDNVDIPIIIYNVPSRTVVDISNETITRLAELKNVVALKDATGDLNRPTQLLMTAKGPFNMLSGDDNTSFAFNALGGVGCISVTSNIAPSICAKVQEFWARNDWQGAFKLNTLLFPLYEAIGCDTNPIAIKHGANVLGLCTPDVRLPLIPTSERNKKLIKDAMTSLEARLEEYEREEYSSAE
jgi:4-hydroxy-tetrahydrodipicolinate synthase